MRYLSPVNIAAWGEGKRTGGSRRNQGHFGVRLSDPRRAESLRPSPASSSEPSLGPSDGQPSVETIRSGRVRSRRRPRARTRPDQRPDPRSASRSSRRRRAGAVWVPRSARSPGSRRGDGSRAPRSSSAFQRVARQTGALGASGVSGRLKSGSATLNASRPPRRLGQIDRDGCTALSASSTSGRSGLSSRFVVATPVTPGPSGTPRPQARRTGARDATALTRICAPGLRRTEAVAGVAR